MTAIGAAPRPRWRRAPPRRRRERGGRGADRRRRRFPAQRRLVVRAERSRPLHGRRAALQPVDRRQPGPASAYGAALCRLFGFSFTVLRFSTVVLATGGVIGFLLLLRACRRARRRVRARRRGVRGEPALRQPRVHLHDRRAVHGLRAMGGIRVRRGIPQATQRCARARGRRRRRGAADPAARHLSRGGRRLHGATRRPSAASARACAPRSPRPPSPSSPSSCSTSGSRATACRAAMRTRSARSGRRRSGRS